MARQNNYQALGQALGQAMADQLAALDTGHGYTLAMHDSYTEGRKWEPRGYTEVTLVLRVYDGTRYVEPEDEAAS